MTSAAGTGESGRFIKVDGGVLGQHGLGECPQARIHQPSFPQRVLLDTSSKRGRSCVTCPVVVYKQTKLLLVSVRRVCRRQSVDKVVGVAIQVVLAGVRRWVDGQLHLNELPGTSTHTQSAVVGPLEVLVEDVGKVSAVNAARSLRCRSGTGVFRVHVVHELVDLGVRHGRSVDRTPHRVDNMV